MSHPESTYTLPPVMKGKKVVLVNHSDTVGGTSVVSFRLLQSLRREGVDARMVVFTKSTSAAEVADVSSRSHRGMAFCLERLRILFSTGFDYSSVFKVSTGHFAVGIDSHPWVKEADIVCLQWINQGLMGLGDLQRLHRAGKKIVWTQHDMWGMTGICHHAYECDYFMDKCGNCQYLSGGGSPNDLSHVMWKRKMRTYSEVPIHFVTVSTWLEQRARKSSLLRNARITTVNNPFPIDRYYCHPPRQVNMLVPHSQPNLILFGAARIDDPIKGLDYTIDALNYIFDNHPEVAGNSTIYFFGALKHPEVLDRLRFSHRWLGRINDPDVLTYLYSSAKVVLSTSLYETLGGTLVEGQAGGALPVCFGGDGRQDVVNHLRTGYIARYKDARDVARGILWALESDISREELHESVRTRFAAPVIARKYIDIFAEMLSDEKELTPSNRQS